VQEIAAILWPLSFLIIGVYYLTLTHRTIKDETGPKIQELEKKVSDLADKVGAIQLGMTR
jgi:hypothetical protein